MIGTADHPLHKKGRREDINYNPTYHHWHWQCCSWHNGPLTQKTSKHPSKWGEENNYRLWIPLSELLLFIPLLNSVTIDKENPKGMMRSPDDCKKDFGSERPKLLND